MFGQINGLLRHGFRVFDEAGFDKQPQQATHACINGGFRNLTSLDGC